MCLVIILTILLTIISYFLSKKAEEKEGISKDTKDMIIAVYTTGCFAISFLGSFLLAVILTLNTPESEVKIVKEEKIPIVEMMLTDLKDNKPSNTTKIICTTKEGKEIILSYNEEILINSNDNVIIKTTYNVEGLRKFYYLKKTVSKVYFSLQ